ncbi:magnesium transporter MgtE N-terminal domain-containing protein [Canibacter zhoujuaniae]|uniref:magnesium transporter MgtE N-terminal domain-containing protein n=1 Tax=Canibacter zhoujuaniae TaxID=2708343 RepID=UPI001421DD73|nr:CBS domain-containing protein [Canibacter zhoujuaniae]
MSNNRVFITRLASRPVFDPYGDRIGKVRDVVVVERKDDPPRVVGFVIEIPGRKRVFVPISDIVSVESGQVISNGLINVRRFEQRGGEHRVIAEIVGRVRPLVAGAESARIEDAALEQTRSGEWVISELFVKIPKNTGPFARPVSKVVTWGELQHRENQTDPNSAEHLIQELVDLKPADLAEALLELPSSRRKEVVSQLPDDMVADALEEMDEADQLAILAWLNSDRAAGVLDQMEPDDAADLISALPDQHGEELLGLMEPEEAEDVRRLLAYEQDTAGGLMNPSPIVLSAESTVAEAMAHIRNSEVPAAMAAAVYVTLPPFETPTGEFKGIVHFQRMLRYPPHETLSTLLDDEIEPVRVDQSAAEVARRLASYDLVAVPIVDQHNNLLGVVTIDDVLDHLLPDDWRHADEDMRGGK